MAELSVSHRAALAHVVERCPDRTLSQLGLAVATMPGEQARALQAMLAEETRDRARRARVMAPLAPLFRPRADGVVATIFPTHVLPRLWKAASAREPALLPMLDDNHDKNVAAVTAVASRICIAAAGVVRDQPDIIWPPGGESEASREAGLAELAGCCDLAPLAHRGLPSLGGWVGRPDGDQLAELRLLVRDSAEVAHDGAQRLLEILFAHLGDAALVLRLVVNSSNVAAREAFLFDSELAVFVDRLIAAVDARVARIATFRPGGAGDPIEALKQDICWSAEVLAELDVTIQLQPGSAWSKQARDARIRINEKLSSLLGTVEKSVEQALPMVRVQTSGRMTRQAPRLDAPIDPAALEAATGTLALVGAVRNAASVFGCEAKRGQLVRGLTERLTTYADQTLEAINGGEAPDEAAALVVVEMTGRFLDLLEATDEARTVRRRAAVAGGPRTGASSAAA